MSYRDQYRHNSTIGLKTKKCIVCGSDCIWFSKKRCQNCARIQDTQKKMEAATETMIKEEDLSGLIADADAVFSQYIRLKYADSKGIVKCFTCNTFKHWTMMQNGHYIKRSHLYLRWDERNCKPQDSDCNEFKGGNIPVFTERLEAESAGIIKILQEEMRIVHKPTREEIRQIISQYTPLVRDMKKKLKPCI